MNIKNFPRNFSYANEALPKKMATTQADLPDGWSELPTFTEMSVPVRIFVSPSGMRVCLLQCEGPLVNLYAVLATEAITSGADTGGKSV